MYDNIAPIEPIVIRDIFDHTNALTILRSDVYTAI